MTITFENNHDVIIHAFEKVIFYARKSQYIFVAQCIWWLASITGLEQVLVIHINNLSGRPEATLQDAIPQVTLEITTNQRARRNLIPVRDTPKGVGFRCDTVTKEPQEGNNLSRQDWILKKCEEYLQDS